MIEAAAGGLGHVVRSILLFCLFVLSRLPFIVGSLLVIFGISMVSDPAAYIAGGVLLYALFAIRPKEKP